MVLILNVGFCVSSTRMRRVAPEHAKKVFVYNTAVL